MPMASKFYCCPIDAIIAAGVASIGVAGIYYVHPGLHPLAYAIGWLVLAGFIYQTGCELSERRRDRKIDAG
jgi:hypothetical protein